MLYDAFRRLISCTKYGLQNAIAISMNHPLKYNKNLIEGHAFDTCPCCGVDDVRDYGLVPRAMHFCSVKFAHAINRAHLLECQSCGLWYKSPSLSEDQLNELYAIQPSDTWSDNAVERRDFMEVAGAINKTDLACHPKILDVGCFNGALLGFIRNNCIFSGSPSLTGIEPSAQAALVAQQKGIQVIYSTYKMLTNGQQQYDLITAVDVFEHVSATASFIQAMAGALTPQGVLIIVTGAADSPVFRRWNKNYNYVCMPEHVSFMTKVHAEWLARKFALDVVEYKLFQHSINSNSVFISIIKRWAFYLLNIIPDRMIAINNRWWHRLGALRGAGIVIQNQSDHALIVFKKRLDSIVT